MSYLGQKLGQNTEKELSEHTIKAISEPNNLATLYTDSLLSLIHELKF